MDLPEKVEQTIKIDMTKAQRKYYDDMKEFMIAEYAGDILSVSSKIALFTKFRQITGGFIPGTDTVIGGGIPAKLRFILDEMDDFSNPFIMWCQFTHEIKSLDSLIRNEYIDIDTATLFGETKNRESIIRGFQEGAFRVLIANPSVGGYGLNFQNTNYSYWYSLTTKGGEFRQANARQHRPGQRNTVFIKRLLCNDSVDDSLLHLLEQKEDMQNIVSGMSNKDFFELF